MNKIWAWVGFPLGIGVLLLLLVFMTSEGGASGTRVQVIDVVEGKGAEVKPGDKVAVNYVGKLKSGKVFDANQDPHKPLTFQVGAGEVIKGWDQGVVGMKPGGIRKLVIPPELAYGDKGAGKVIPPNSELHFEIRLLAAMPGGPPELE